jgi:hypothetical protein
MNVAPEALDTIRQLARDYGLAIKGVTLHKDVLAIVPDALDDLPSPDRCRAMAEKIQALGYRYVTLEIPFGDAP